MNIETEQKITQLLADTHELLGTAKTQELINFVTDPWIRDEFWDRRQQAILFLFFKDLEDQALDQYHSFTETLADILFEGGYQRVSQALITCYVAIEVIGFIPEEVDFSLDN